MATKKKEEKKKKNAHAVALGQMGGKARSQKLTPERRRQIGRSAAAARWSKEKKKKEGA